VNGVPPHHGPDGFRNPWPTDEGRPGFGDFLRWRRERAELPREPLPDLPLAVPAPAQPRAAAGEVRLTWIGHATLLIQAGPLNVLTDPVWSDTVSPVPGLGPRRLVAPGLAFDALPPIDAVLLSHDHYDHLDAPTVRRLARAHPDAVWITPIGYRRWLRRRGVPSVRELDWWEPTCLDAAGVTATITALPAQHWTRRTPLDTGKRLWASYALEAPPARIYFAGDSGYCPAFAEIGARMGPFDALLLPIGAYEPRWFMRTAHMDPDEAVQAWLDLGGSGRLVAMHWGTFIMTDEPVLEPPARLRSAWDRAQNNPGQLSILRHGETLRWERQRPQGTA
jgi:N-acyl-phosphatidylethanolamine-hydrolysing phospholipase D